MKIIRDYGIVALSILFLLNFTLGVYEVPDNLPIVGHIDEVAASAALIYALQRIRTRRRAHEKWRGS